MKRKGGARHPRVGLLGGGQLARMLALKAQDMGLESQVLSSSAQDPAARVCHHWVQGDPSCAQDLKSFLKQVDVASFESEFVSPEALAKLPPNLKAKIQPRPEIMVELQDRLSQKQLLKAHHLPSADFHAVNTLAEAEQALEALSGEMILKKRRFGYDGYGTFHVKSGKDLRALRAQLEAPNSPGFIAEERVAFQRELALLACRNQTGQVVQFPLVESYQQDKRCLWVKGPIDFASPEFPQLQKKISKFLKSLDYQGVMAFELFEKEGRLLVNELAPRVHNSGHYSLNALDMDQFTAHLRAILGWDLRPPKALYPGFAMYNLLGSSNKPPSWGPLPQDVFLHWYDKFENRPGRKMGHLNAAGPSAKQALLRLKKTRKDFQL